MLHLKLMILLKQLLRLGLLVVMSGSVLAQSGEPVLLGKFEGWNAYAYRTPESRVCYITAEPRTRAPKSTKRDPAYFLVTRMPGKGVKAEVSTIIGYPFKKESQVSLVIDGKEFIMRTDADGAWAEDTATDNAIVVSMLHGKAMTLRGTSWRGTDTLDTYGLEGVRAALGKIAQACK